MLIPDDQVEKQKIIRDFAPSVETVRIARPQPIDLQRLVMALATLRRRLAIAANEAPRGEAERRLVRLVSALDAVVRKIQQRDPDVVEASLTVLQRHLYQDFVRSFQQLQANLDPRPIGLGNIPVELRHQFVSPRGRFLLEIHSAVDIWDRAGAERFVQELRSVDPDVTGGPIITFEAIRLMERAYWQGTLYAVVFVTLIAALTLRRWRETLLALLPLGLGLMWTAGLMYVFDLKFTLGNVFGLPLILGFSAEYGLNIVLRFAEGRRYGGPLIARSTVMGVLVAGLSTLAGFGSLFLARHRGIFGLGLLLTLGSVMSLIAALVVLPVLLRMVQQLRDTRRARRLARARGTPESPAAAPHTVGHQDE
jgi:predicted RND superfamily exporter protein